MREIKFRAWDNVDFKMIYLGEDNDYVFEMVSSGFHCTKLGENPFDYEILEHLKYMQYTGLKANGKEIYEGDIVKHEFYGNCLVSWSDKFLCYELKDHNHLLQRVDEKRELMEVIGNIYENPELLENE